MPTSGGVQLVKRFGSPTKSEAQAVAERAGKLLGLATDETTRKRIGDLIATAKRGASLPSAEDAARRIGIERLNAALAAKHGGSRSFVCLDGDVRTRPRHVGSHLWDRVPASTANATGNTPAGD